MRLRTAGVLMGHSSYTLSMMNEFKQFLLRGNVVDLAVGVVIGAAFTSVVNALVKDLLTPLIGAIAQVPDFSGLMFTLNGSQFMYGEFMNAAIAFLLVASAVFFFVIKPMNLLIERARKEKPGDPDTRKCPECLSEIPFTAKRCSHCTQVVKDTD
jgi:large conductance mechanosensitive channel